MTISMPAGLDVDCVILITNKTVGRPNSCQNISPGPLTKSSFLFSNLAHNLLGTISDTSNSGNPILTNESQSAPGGPYGSGGKVRCSSEADVLLHRSERQVRTQAV
jgi:hypothetical protein